MQKSSRLAIYALLELASDPTKQVSVSEIGEKFRVSSHHLAKVMHTLGRAGLVTSVRGVGGGYCFNGNAKRVTMLDIIGLFEDTTGECKLNDVNRATPVEWAVFDVMCEIDDIAMATLGSITIATLLKQMGRQKNRSDAEVAAAT